MRTRDACSVLHSANISSTNFCLLPSDLQNIFISVVTSKVGKNINGHAYSSAPKYDSLFFCDLLKMRSILNFFISNVLSFCWNTDHWTTINHRYPILVGVHVNSSQKSQQIFHPKRGNNLLLLLAYRFTYCIHDQADDDRDHHIRQSVSDRRIHMHKNAVQNKADQPDNQI